MAAWELRLGDFDFTPGVWGGDVDVRVVGLRRGKPVPVVSTIESLLQDGAIERVDRHDNRDQSIIVGFKASDSLALAQAESDLFVEAQKRQNELSWTPPDGIGATTVFDVLWADVEFTDADEWDLDELRGYRAYILTFRCAPFGRSAVEAVDEALGAAASPTVVVVSDGTSASGWSSPYGALTVESGKLRTPDHYTQTSTGGGVVTYYGGVDVTYTFGAPVDFTATQFVSVDLVMGSGTSWYSDPSMYADGVPLVLVASQTVSSSVTRFTFLCLDASVSTLRFVPGPLYATAPVGSPAPGFNAFVDNLQRANQSPAASSTGRESTRNLSVMGSARTQGSMALSHETAALGKAILYSTPSLATGYTPDLRRWRSSGGTVTADAATVSGGRESLGGLGVTFNVPAAQLPRGGYLLMAFVRSTASSFTAFFDWTVDTKIGSSLFGHQSGRSDGFAVTGSSWSLVTIGAMVLPTTDVAAGSSASVQIAVGESVGTEVDEVFLFHVGDDAALTIVDCGAGAPALGSANNRLWIDTPSLAHPSPAIWLGTNADKSDAFHAGERASAWGQHSFVPGGMKVFVVTTGAANPSLSLRHFPRWHTHAVA